MLIDTATEVFNEIWSMILIITVIVSSLRLCYLISGHKKIVIYKELLSLFFIIYILCLYHVVSFQDINYGGINLTPFKEMFRYEILSEKFLRNILGNIILFIPYGMYVSYFLKTKKFFFPLVLTAIASTTIEYVQYHIGRVFDIDDIILNIVGGIIGYLLFIGINAIKQKLPRFMRKDTFLNIVIILIILLIVIYGFKIDLLGMW